MVIKNLINGYVGEINKIHLVNLTSLHPPHQLPLSLCNLIAYFLRIEKMLWGMNWCPLGVSKPVRLK